MDEELGEFDVSTVCTGPRSKHTGSDNTEVVLSGQDIVLLESVECRETCCAKPWLWVTGSMMPEVLLHPSIARKNVRQSRCLRL